MIAWAKTHTLSSAPFSRYLPTRASGKQNPSRPSQSPAAEDELHQRLALGAPSAHALEVVVHRPKALDRVVAGCRIQGLAAGRRIIGVREKHLREVGEGLVLELGLPRAKGPDRHRVSRSVYVKRARPAS